MTGAERFPGLTLSEIEGCLAGPQLPDSRRRALEAEYERRLTLELLGDAPCAPAAPVGIPLPHAQPQDLTAPPPPSLTRPIPQPPLVPPSRPYARPPAALPPQPVADRREKTGRGPGFVLALVLLAGVVAVGAWLAGRPAWNAIWSLWPHSSSPAPWAVGPGSAAPNTPGMPVAPDGTEGTGGLDSDSYAGATGTVEVDWEYQGTAYAATVTTAKASGQADVRFTDPSGTAHVVRESLTLDGHAGAWRYVGSNVRDPVTGASAVPYTPDAFYLASTGTGVRIDHVCDTQSGSCVPARMVVR